MGVREDSQSGIDLAGLIAKQYAKRGYTPAEQQQIRSIAAQKYKDGMSTEEVNAFIGEQSIVQNKLSGNKGLQAKGLAPLNVTDYYNTVDQLHDLIANYSDLLPPNVKLKMQNGKLKAPMDFVNSIIGSGSSPAEVEQRFQIATDYAKNTDPNVKAMLKQYYGIGDSQIAQYALLPKESQAEFVAKYQTVKIGSAAADQSLDINKELARSISDKGISAKEAAQTFEGVAKNADTYSLLGGISGNSITTEEQVKAEFGLSAEAAQKEKSLRQTETARFSGTGAGTNQLGGSISGQY